MIRQVPERFAVALIQVCARSRFSFCLLPLHFLLSEMLIAAGLLQTGRFQREDAFYVWGILAGSAVGLLASTLGRLYSSTYYALRDTRTPLRYALVRVALTTGLGYVFAIYLPGWLNVSDLGRRGLTASAGIAGWFEMVLLRRTLNTRIGKTGLPPGFVVKLAVAAIAGAVVAWIVKSHHETNFWNCGSCWLLATCLVAAQGRGGPGPEPGVATSAADGRRRRPIPPSRFRPGRDDSRLNAVSATDAMPRAEKPDRTSRAPTLVAAGHARRQDRTAGPKLDVPKRACRRFDSERRGPGRDRRVHPRPEDQSSRRSAADAVPSMSRICRPEMPRPAGLLQRRGNCATCHSATGDLAGIGYRFQGLPLLQRMLYPTSGRPAPAPPKVTVTLPSGEKHCRARWLSRDEFTITVVGSRRSAADLASERGEIQVDDPLSAHFDQLGKYTDTDMHNVFAYLETLK